LGKRTVLAAVIAVFLRGRKPGFLADACYGKDVVYARKLGDSFLESGQLLAPVCYVEFGGCGATLPDAVQLLCCGFSACEVAVGDEDIASSRWLERDAGCAG
jgi:hypothetical protein